MSTPQEHRRYPRIDHVASNQILSLDTENTPHKNYIITQNMSACGIRFTTNQHFTPLSHFLIYLNDAVVKEIHQEASHSLFRLGDHYLAKVVWTREMRPGYYDVGAAFMERGSCGQEDLEVFNELMNLSMLDMLPELSNRV